MQALKAQGVFIGLISNGYTDAFAQELAVKVGFECKTVAHYFLEKL